MTPFRPRRFAPFAALLLAACAGAATLPPAPASAPAAATTVVVVRHAERASETDRDPPLSAAGEARAAALAEALADAGVAAVYATEFRRTQDTARPLAARLGLTVLPSPAADPAAIAGQVLARHRGATVLLVGHSNTVGPLVRALGGRAPDLTSTDYDDLFVVTIGADGRVGTVKGRYGAVSE